MGAKYPEEEREIIRKHYATLGPTGVQKLLPHVSRAAIADRAKQMGLRCRAPYKTSAERLAALMRREERRQAALAVGDDADDTPKVLRFTQDEWIKLFRPVVPKGGVRWVFDLGHAR